MPDDVISIPVGYADPMIGVTAWPGVSAAFMVETTSPGARLCLTAAFQAGSYLPGSGQGGATVAKMAKDPQARYARIYYQIMQSDVRAGLITTLEQAPGQAPKVLDVPMGPLRNFVAGIHGWLTSMTDLHSVRPDPTLCHTLEDVVEHYGVSFENLGAANGALIVGDLFASSIFIPVYALFRQGDTVKGLYPTDPKGVLLDSENLDLLLKAGTELTIPARVVIAPAEPASLTALARAQKCSVRTLIVANASRANLIAQAFPFVMEGVTVRSSADLDTLDRIAQAFRDQHGVQVDSLMVGAAYADTAGLFVPNAAFSVDRYLVAPGNTLRTNQSQVSLTDLADLNIDTVDIFEAGMPVYLREEAGTSAMSLSLAEAARTQGVTVSQLLRHNAALPLRQPSTLEMPGQTALPRDPTALRLPYCIRAEDTLAIIADRFLPLDPGNPSLGLASANAAWPGTLTPGRAVVVGSQQVLTQEGDSFQAVADRFTPPVALTQVVQAIATTPGYLAPGGLLLCAPGVLTLASAPTPKQAGVLFGLNPVDLLVANGAVAGCLSTNQRVTLQRGDKIIEVTTSHPGDPESHFTLNSLVTAFALQGVETTLPEILRANLTVPFLAAGARLLVPPAPIALGADFGISATTQATQWTFPGAIFAVHTWVQLRRDPNLVLPELRGTAEEPSPTEAARSIIPPQSTQDASDGEDALRLQAFAQSLEKAVPVSRICTGKVRTAIGMETDVWAVAFGPDFIQSVEVGPPAADPRFFALRPLYNHLVSREGVPIQPLKDDGTYGEVQTVDYQGVDLETWATDFLTDVDLFLSAPYATGAYGVASGSALSKILAAKAPLAEAVANGLDYILDLGQPQPETLPPDWVAARDALKQRLLISLGQAWETDVVLQYDARIDVAQTWQPLNARLSGPAVLQTSPAGGDGKRVGVAGAKTSLALPSSYVTFSVSIHKTQSKNPDAPPEEALQSFLELDMAYGVNEVEFDVQPAPLGYESSAWLSFILPPTQTAVPLGWQVRLGATRAPVPLRAYPAQVILVAQSASAMPNTTTWHQAVNWQYAFTYRHPSASQDQIRFEVTFNNRPILLKSASAIDDLFSALAQYQAIRPRLWEFLKGLLEPSSGEAPAPLVNALGNYADLVVRVKDRWKAHWHIPPAPAWPSPSGRLARGASDAIPALTRYLFTATLAAGTAPKNAVYGALILSLDDAIGTPRWPKISVVTPDGKTYELIPTTDAGVTTYDFPPGSDVAVGTLLAFQITFDGLHVATQENATSRVWVVRNAHLLGPSGPSTRDAFIYQTPPVAFPDLVVPHLTWEIRSPIGTWDAQGTPLDAVFREVLQGDLSGQHPLNLAVRYGFQLVPNTIVTALPVGLWPCFGYTGTQAQTTADFMASWKQNHDPATTGGEWQLAVSLYSALDGSRKQPLLELRNLVSDLPPQGSKPG